MPPYGRLSIPVDADLRGFETAVTKSAQAAGDQAARQISGSLSNALKASTQILGSVGKAAAVGLTGITAAAAGFGVASFRAAARVGEMNASLKALAQANKLSYPEMQKQVRGIRDTGIEAGVAQDLVAQFARNQLDLAQSSKLARVAQDLAVISGRNSTEVLADLTHGIMTNNTQVLRNAGSNVMAGQALAAYAKQLGKNQAELSSTERAQAILNAVIADGSKVAGAYESAMQEPGKALRSFRRIVDDIKVSVGEGLVTAFGPAILQGYQLAKAFSLAIAEGGPLSGIFDALGESVAKLTAPLAPMIKAWTDWVKNLKPEQVERITEAVRRFGPAILLAAGGLAAFVAPQLLGSVPVLGQALSALTGPASVLAKQLGSIGVQAASTLVPGLTSGGAAAGTFGAALGSAALPVTAIVAAIAVLALASEKFRNALFGLGRGLVQFFAPIASALVYGLRQILPPIWDVIRAIGDALAPVITRLTPLLKPLGQLVGVYLRVNFMLLGAVLRVVAQVIILLLRGIGWLLDQIFRVVGPVVAFTEAVARWASVLTQANGPLRVVTNSLRWLSDAIAGVVRWIFGGSPGLIPAFVALQQVVGSATAFIQGVVVAAFGVIRSVIVGVWSAATAASTYTWGVITSTVRLASQTITAIIQFLLATIAAAWSAALAGTRAAWSAITAAVVAAWSAIRSATAAASSAVVSVVGSAWSAARSATAASWSAITGLVASAWSSIRANTAAQSSATLSITRTAWQNTSAATVQIWTQIRDFIANAWRQIVAGARAAGVDVINGLKAGFQQAMANIGSWIKANVVDPIVNAVKQFFGIHSPSTVMAELGVFLVKGLFKGMVPGISGLGNLIKMVFGGWPEALAALIAQGLVALAGLPKKALDAIMGLFGSGSAANLAATAQTFAGHRYVWGGGANKDTGFDCSSFVNMLAGMLGLPIPGGFRAPSQAHGPVTTDWLNFGTMQRVGGLGTTNDIAVNGQHMGVLIGPNGAGFAARSTATGTGPQHLPAGSYTHLRFPSTGPAQKVAGWLQGALGKISGMFGSLFGGGQGPTGTGQSWNAGVRIWESLVVEVLRELGRPDLFAVIMSQMQTESGGNARAINLWDSNARAGIPSKGLMQVIDPTFNAYAGPYLSRGIWDPKANIYAGVNYALRRYGANVARVLGRGVGYATGGIIGEPVVGIGMRSGTPYRFGERGPELVSPLAGPGPNVAYGGGSRIAIAVYPSPGMDERALAAAVARELAWAQAGGQI